MIGRFAKLFFAAICYLLALLPMIYFVGFLGNFVVPRTVDSGPVLPHAVPVDLALIASFAVVHSLLARPAWRARVAQLTGNDLERLFYSALAGVQIILLMALWRPLPGALWSVSSGLGQGILWALFWAGWALVLAGAGALGTARLYGLEAVWLRFRGRPQAAESLELRGPYRWVRHPLYSGTILALWAAPEMSPGRALLAAGFTVYILVGFRLEERDLAERHGEGFRGYREHVGAFLPRFRRRRAASSHISTSDR